MKNTAVEKICKFTKILTTNSMYFSIQKSTKSANNAKSSKCLGKSKKLKDAQKRPKKTKNAQKRQKISKNVQKSPN